MSENVLFLLFENEPQKKKTFIKYLIAVRCYLEKKKFSSLCKYLHFKTVAKFDKN